MRDEVRATLNYSVDNGIPPDYYFYEPEQPVKLNPPGTDPHEVAIVNGWPRVEQFDADRQGFELRPFPAAFSGYDDAAAVQDVFYPQVVDFVKRNTGANRVVIFDHTLRKRLPADLSQQTTVNRPAVLLVHSDYTIASGPQRVRDLLPDEADELLKGRVQVINLWRPLKGPLQDAPLALCDAGTIDQHDLVASDLVYKDRVGETYSVTYNPAHRWYYAPELRREEALLLKIMDSKTDGRARFMPHTSFTDPTTPADAFPRESIELRTLVFHPN